MQGSNTSMPRHAFESRHRRALPWTEWTSFMHPDPAAEQLAALKDVLRKLMKGDTDVMANAMLRFVYKFNLHTSGAVWKDMLPRAYLWFDFMSMPQPLAGGGGMHNIAAAAASGHAGLSDHRNSVNEEDENLVLNLQLAVDSIPSCVAAPDPLVVPSPFTLATPFSD